MYVEKQFRRVIIKNISVRLFTTLIILFNFAALAQVFLPYSFWSNQTGLSVLPSSPVYLLAGNLLTFSASGASGTYSWSITAAAIADGATVTTPGSTSDYTARLTPNTADTLTVTSGTSTVNISIYAYDPITIAPTSVTMAINTTQNFITSAGCLNATCSGGTATWSVVSGGGSITSGGVFTAPAIAGTTIVQVADAIGNITQATVTIVSNLTISPIGWSTQNIKLPVYSTETYSATLGSLPYTYSIFAGTGTNGCQSTINPAITNASTTITVANTTGCPSTGAIYIDSETICYNSMTATTFTGLTRGCNATTAAAHVINSVYNLNKTVHTAPSSTGTGTVRVTDASTFTSDSVVTYIKPVDITMGYAFACVLYNEGSVKCWGENNGGQLGIGSTTSVGTLGTQQGGAIAFVNLGAGRTATQIAAGWYHVCALLDNATVKCWGQNTYGQLGQGNTTNVGVATANDVANLAAIDFKGKTPNQIFAFGYLSCAKFTDTTSTCWGYNTSGQAGQGTTTNITAPPNSGGTLTTINYGAGRYATKLVGGPDFTCAILDNATVKCWGLNGTSELGDGTTTTRAVSPSTLSAINLGASRTALDISAGADAISAPYDGHACAVLDNGTVACWGQGGNGQIGDNMSLLQSTPTQTTALGFTASKVWAARRWTCVKSTANTVKCWGQNSRGQLLAGNTTTQPSASAANIVNWGTGVGFLTMAAQGRTGCMVTGGGTSNNDRIKCWGTGANSATVAVGALLYPGIATNFYLGDVAGELGDGLPFVNH